MVPLVRSDPPELEEGLQGEGLRLLAAPPGGAAEPQGGFEHQKKQSTASSDSKFFNVRRSKKMKALTAGPRSPFVVAVEDLGPN